MTSNFFKRTFNKENAVKVAKSTSKNVSSAVTYTKKIVKTKPVQVVYNTIFPNGVTDNVALLAAHYFLMESSVLAERRVPDTLFMIRKPTRILITDNKFKPFFDNSETIRTWICIRERLESDFELLSCPRSDDIRSGWVSLTLWSWMELYKRLAAVYYLVIGTITGKREIVEETLQEFGLIPETEVLVTSFTAFLINIGLRTLLVGVLYLIRTLLTKLFKLIVKFISRTLAPNEYKSDKTTNTSGGSESDSAKSTTEKTIEKTTENAELPGITLLKDLAKLIDEMEAELGISRTTEQIDLDQELPGFTKNINKVTRIAYIAIIPVLVMLFLYFVAYILEYLRSTYPRYFRYILSLLPKILRKIIIDLLASRFNTLVKSSKNVQDVVLVTLGR